METLPCLLMKKVMPWAELKIPGVNGRRHIFEVEREPLIKDWILGSTSTGWDLMNAG